MEDHTSRSISNLLTRLLEAHTLTSEAKGRLDQFRAHAAPPAPASEEFRDVQALADFTNQRARFQRELDQLTVEHQVHLQRYEDEKGAVAAILPPGTSIVHDYQGEHYFIRRDGTGRFEVRPMTPEEYDRRQREWRRSQRP